MSDRIEIIEQNVRQYIPHFFVDYLGLPDREIVVLLALKSFAWNHKDNCHPSIEKIARRVNKKSRQVGEIIQCLAQRGLVVIENRPGHSSRYILTNKELKDCVTLSEEIQPEPNPCGNPRTTPAEIRVPTPAEIRVQNSISINNKKNNKISCPSDDGLSKEEECFNQFWESYPRKEAKKDARKAWKKIKQKDYEQIIGDIHLRKNKNWKGKDNQYIPLPASYLNGERWGDEFNQGESVNGKQTKTDRGYNIQDRLEQRTAEYLQSLQYEQCS